MGLFDLALGAPLVATYLNAMLLMIEMIEVYRYFRMYRIKDKMALKVAVAAALFIDITCTITICIVMYQYLVTHWGDPVFLSSQHPSIPVFVIATQVTALIVQAFLIARYYIFAKNIFVALVLGLAALAAFGGAMTSAILVALYPNYTDRFKLQTPVLIWLVTSAAADVSIAAALIFQLRQMSSSIKRTQSLLAKLTTDAIRTGASGSIIAVLVLITYLQNKESNVAVACAMILGRVYALTMLRNLNTRGAEHGVVTEGSSNTWADSTRGPVHINMELQAKSSSSGMASQTNLRFADETGGSTKFSALE
ncbi:hypothetical protein C8J56DRAFT_1020395 [Mycena floridula]|nr:hypothetical protein C8J56DRAFT_1020395 [Mycena floridula]